MGALITKVAEGHYRLEADESVLGLGVDASNKIQLFHREMKAVYIFEARKRKAEEINAESVSGFDDDASNKIKSLKNCDKLTIKGDVEFAVGVTCIGDVTFSNPGKGTKVVAAGTYENTTVEL